MIALITGGSGCGKSTWAEGLAVRLGGRRYYLATMPVDAGMALGEGAGAVAVMPLVDMALAVYGGA